MADKSKGGTESENGTEKAVSTALEFIKQLMTLAAGVLALSATFVTKQGHHSWYLLLFLFGAWSSLLISLVYSFQTISCIVQSQIDSDAEWSEGKGRKWATTAKWLFFTGILLFAMFAFLSLATPKPSGSSNSVAEAYEYVLTSQTKTMRKLEEKNNEYRSRSQAAQEQVVALEAEVEKLNKLFAVQSNKCSQLENKNDDLKSRILVLEKQLQSIAQPTETMP